MTIFSTVSVNKIFYQKLKLVFVIGAVRCSFVVRAFTHGVMGHQINPSLWIHGDI